MINNRAEHNKQVSDKIGILLPILSDSKYRAVRYTLLTVVLTLVAVGQNVALVPEWTFQMFVVIDILTIMLTSFVIVVVNLRWLIPRLLLRGRYAVYAAVLLGLAFSISSVSLLFEWLAVSVFGLQTSELSVFADNNNTSLFFQIFSGIIFYFMFLIAISMTVFLRHWWKSGNRINELTELGTRADLEKMRTKINSDALFNTLNRAADTVISFPQETTDTLLKLSKSLRTQLYESDKEELFSATDNTAKRLFGKQHQLLNFLIESRFRLTRNLLFIFVICLLVGSVIINPDSDNPLIDSVFFVGLLLGLIYFSRYVLVPHLVLKNRWITYFLVIAIIAFSPFLILFVGGIAKLDVFSEHSMTAVVLILLGQTVQITFMFIGTTAFVLFQHWIRNERRISRLEESAMQAELEQLQNQINPHFLFNMLNNILVLIRTNPQEASDILHKMNDMLKYQFNTGTKNTVLLKDDIQFLTDYLNLEKIRRDDFEFTISVDTNAENLNVPPLLFIPFVENAVKHGNDTANLSYIHLDFKKKEDGLYFSCQNSKPQKPSQKNKFGGLGLVNVRRRLELLYDKKFSLDIHENETTYTIQLTIKI